VEKLRAEDRTPSRLRSPFWRMQRSRRSRNSGRATRGIRELRLVEVGELSTIGPFLRNGAISIPAGKEVAPFFLLLDRAQIELSPDVRSTTSTSPEDRIIPLVQRALIGPFSSASQRYDFVTHSSLMT
jgi:hypothetical protein